MRPSVVLADITTLAVDAIVNAANAELLPGGGVCGAIHRASGPTVAQQCAALGHCETGKAKATTAGNLPARFIIHAVGPVFTGPDDAVLLASAYASALELADSLRCRSIAFPCISMGIYGYPPDEACRIAVSTVRAFKGEHLTDVTFCVFSGDDLARYRRELEA